MLKMDAAETRERLPYRALCGALLSVLTSMRRGQTTCPTRMQVHPGPKSTMLLMMACDESLAVTKVVTVHPGNTVLPTVQSDVSATNVADGARLFTCDGNVVTERRTSALSAAAVTVLRPQFAAAPIRVVIVGSGTQAHAHKAALEAMCNVAEVTMFARQSKDRTGADAYGITAEDLMAADVVVTATSSTTPVLTEAAAAAIRSDAMVCAVGAFTPTMAELPPLFVRRCRIVVDDATACAEEAGDLLQAQVNFETDVEDLAHAMDEPSPSRTMLFKSVGCALWDLAAARCIQQGLSNP